MNLERIQELEVQLDSARRASARLEQIDVLNALAWELGLADADRAARVAQEALDLSRGSDAPENFYEKGVGLSLRTLGYLARMRSDYDSALSLLLEARAMLEDQPGEDCRSGLIDVLGSLGWVFFCHGDFPTSIEILLDALHQARETGNPQQQAEILNSLGAVYGESGDKEQSIEVLQRSLSLLEGSEALRTRSVTHNNLAMTQFEVQAYAQALDNAAKSVEIARQLGSPDLLATFLDTTGQVYLAMQDYARAEEYFQQAMDLYQGIGNDPNEITLNLARAALGQGRLEEAAERLQHSLEPLEARGVNRFSYQFHELLSRIYELQGDFSRAVWHYKRFHAIQSQVFGEETQHRLGNLAVLHQVETARLDAEILRLKNLALHQEISASRQALAEMQVKATTDALTGMLNRRHFMTLASYLFDASRQSGKPLAALMMDIDHFKNVNDAFGHHAGDQVLAEISAVIQANLRSGDLLGRYGGEEFVAVLPDSHLSEAYQVAQRVLEKVAGHSTCCGALSIQITLSIGTAQSDAADASLESLLKRADLALYAAKRLGKNRVI